MSGFVERRGAGRWRARYRGPDRKERSRTFNRKIDADRWLASVQVALDRGDWVDPARARVSVGDWSREWLKSKEPHLKATTRESYRSLLATCVLPRWESVPLVAVSYADVAGWVGELSERVGPSRCRKAAMVLRAVLDAAVRDQRLPRNPSLGVRLPRLPEQEKRFLTLAELVGLAGAAGRDRLMVLVMGVCGLRFGEVVALRVGCVDAIRGRLIVRASVSEVGGHVVWSTPKSHQSRQVPVPASLMVQLSVAIRGRAADELVFTSPEGATIRAGNWRRRVWDRAVAASGLESLTPHDLRHTAASLAISSGASVKHIQRMLGHKDASMTLNVYASLFEDDLDLVGQRIDGLLVPLAASMRPVEGLSAASAKTRRNETAVD